ncbi:MAG: glycosyltransferase family 2 protein [Alphaproteobacteria bacterium]
MTIPVTVIVATKNEERRIARCLSCLQEFDEVVVLDSGSADRTKAIALSCGARVEDFAWNGLYPKKRQWALDHLSLKHDRVFFVDADEQVTPELVREIAGLDWNADGYFVKGRYLFEGRLLRFGLCNNKLVLLDRRRVYFPVVDDLGLVGMGEMEGHYQPVLKGAGSIGVLRNFLVHDAYDARWIARHERYAVWEAGMMERGAWPGEVSLVRRVLKSVFRRMPMRPLAAFLHCYVLKMGFLDGVRGVRFALSRAAYYRMISRASKGRVQTAAPSRRPFAGRR